MSPLKSAKRKHVKCQKINLKNAKLFQVTLQNVIPDNCHFFYTDKIFGAKNLHPSARKSGQIGFRDKIA